MLMDASRCFTLQSCTASPWYQTLENPFPSPAAMSQSIALYFWPDIKIPQILGENMDSQNNTNCLTRNWLEAVCTGRNWLERKRTKGETGIVSSCFCDWFMKWFWQSLWVFVSTSNDVGIQWANFQGLKGHHVDLSFIQPAMAMWKLHFKTWTWHLQTMVDFPCCIPRRVLHEVEWSCM